MANPILSRPDAFQSGAPQQYGQQYGQQFDPYGRPIPQQPMQAPEGRMTLDDVLTKAGVLLGGVVLAAAAMFYLFGAGLVPVQAYLPIVIGSGIVTFVASLLVGLRRVVSPWLVGIFALAEGAFVGAFSYFMDTLFNGIVIQAVLGTIIAAALTFAAFRFGGLRVGPKVGRIVIIATISFAVLMLVNFVLALAGINTGARAVGGDAGPLAWGISALAIVLCVFNLLMDFDNIESGVRNGAPRSMAWKAAFGLTVTLVWMYIEILRILSYFRQN